MTQSEAASVAAAPADTRAGRGAWLVLAAVLPGMFMNVFDFFAVNVATPVLHRNLGSGPPALELIVGGYGLTFSLGLVTGGRLGDRYGRRRVFATGMAAFTLASAASGLAPTSDILVVARLVQGAAAAMMVPQVLSIIRVSFPARERRVALGLYGMTIAVGQVSGQALGGILLSANIAGLSWRPIFLVNVPVAILTAAFGFRHVPESRSPARPSLDLRGVGLLTLAAGLLIIPVVEGGALGWPLWCWLSLAAVPVAGAAFVWWERRVRVARQPLIDLGLFRSRDFRRGLFVNVTLYATISSFFFALGLYLQTGRGDSPLVAGLTFVPLAAGNFVASLSSGRLVERFGRSTLTAGAALQAGGLLVLLAAAGPGRPTALVLAGVTLFGFGQGLLIPPIIGVVLSRVPVTDSGAATGVLVTVQQMSGTIGLTLVSLGFFADAAGGRAGGYVTGFQVACGCDLALALVSLTLSRLLSAQGDRRALLLSRDARRAVAEALDQRPDEVLARLQQLVLRHAPGEPLGRLREHRRPERDRDERQRQKMRIELRVDLAALLRRADRQQVPWHRVLGVGRVVGPAVQRLPHQHARPLLPARRHRQVDVGEQAVGQRLVGDAAHEVVEVLFAQPLAHRVVQAPFAAEVVVERSRADVRPAHDALHARAGETVLREFAHGGAQYPLGCRGRHLAASRRAPVLGHQLMIERTDRASGDAEYLGPTRRRTARYHPNR